MPAPFLSLVWGRFIFNLLLQILDGVLTYQVLSLGIAEGNPLVRNAIAQWGALWGLLYWKAFACFLLAVIFMFRHRRQALIVKALTLTATVYACVALAGFCELLIRVAA